jgi:hypothetical protein
MTPTLSASIPLDELNVMIAEQKNMAVDDLCTLVSGYSGQEEQKQESAVPTTEPVQETATEVLTDKDLAKSYRSQADAMYKEAARLRRQADEIDPPIKKSATKVTQPEDA